MKNPHPGKTSEHALFERGEACFSSDVARDSFRWRGQGKCRRSLGPKLLQPNRSSQMFHCAQVGERLLPRQQWSTPGRGPIGLVGRCLRRWYDWRQPKCRNHGGPCICTRRSRTKVEPVVNLKAAKTLGQCAASDHRPRRRGDRMKRGCLLVAQSIISACLLLRRCRALSGHDELPPSASRHELCLRPRRPYTFL